tara:strand:- start:233 stop:1702 length:1470 start_codon:yes stop_codon:yes gene_type:complete
MAIGTISLPQSPVEGSAKIPAITNWTPALPYTAKQTDITDLYYFKFILEIKIDDSSGELLGKIKQRPNGYTTGTTNVYTVFDISDIINTQLENTYADQNDTTKSIHTLGSNVASKPFSHNYNQVKYIYVKVYQEYSAGASISPQENATVNATNQKYYIAASLPLETARGTTYFQGTAFQVFQTKDANGRFLSDVQQSSGNVVSSSVYRNYVQWDDSTNTGDFHTVAFLNDEDNFDSDIDIIEINYYTSAGVAIGSPQKITNENATGGANPATSGGEVNTNAERLIYFGCGPGNLQASTVTPVGGSSGDARPSNFSNWAYYTIQGKDDTGTPAASTAIYYFVKQDASCKGFKVRRLGWLNSLGCWDYFNFKMKSKQTVNVKRDTYGKLLGEYNSTAYSYNNFDSTRKVRKTDAILKETLNTDWISEEDAELLEKCVMSTDVFIIENADTDYTVPVLVTNTSIIRKTNANDGIKIKYTINIEYSNPLNTNN